MVAIGVFSIESIDLWSPATLAVPVEGDYKDLEIVDVHIA